MYIPTGYPIMRKGLLFAKRTTLKDEKGFCIPKEFITLDRLRKGLHVEKKDNYFSEKEFDFRPAMLATMRKGLQVVKMDNCFSKKGFDFRTATLVTVRKGLDEKDSIL